MSERFPYSFGKYRVEAEIGRGGFGNVFRAVDTALERPIALKLLDPIYMRDRSWINRFRREAIVMAQLDHPHIVPIYDTGEIDGRLYLAMRLVDGPNLSETLERRGRLPWEEALALTRQIAAALDYAHGKDVLHRDLKPANVLLEGERALLTDFGLARLVGSNTMSMSTHGGIAGTYQYMAPELFDDKEPQRATDVYALGCILYEAVTGDVLFDAGSTAAIISAHLRPLELPETLAEDVPPGLADVLHIALAREPHARYQSGAELLAALENVESDRLAEPYAALEQAVARQEWETALSLADTIHAADANYRDVQALRAQAQQGQEGVQRQQWADKWRGEAEVALVQDDVMTAEVALKQWRKVAPDDREVAAFAKRLDLLRQYKKLEQAVNEERWGEAQPLAQTIQKEDPTFRDVAALAARIEAHRRPEVARKPAPEPEKPTAQQQTTAQTTTAAPARGERSIPTWVWGIGGVVALALFIWGGGALFGGDDVTPTPDRVDEIANRPTATATGTATATNTPASTAMPITQPTATPTATSRPTQTPTRTPTATPERSLPPADAELGDTWTRPADEMVMVYVPAGSFQMGSEDGATDEKPVHEVTLDAFWLDRTEVTNAQFAAFVEETGYLTTAEEEGDARVFTGGGWEDISGAEWQHPQGPDSGISGLDDYPVIQVSWDDAAAYCEWTGAKLPTEAQWEYAARGPEGAVYPWSDTFDGSLLNLCDSNCDLGWADESVDDGYEQTAPVGAYPGGASWAGALDMAGNVWEWVQDWYDEDYYASSPAENPPGPPRGDFKVLRGGSWSSNSSNVRASFRVSGVPTYRVDFSGFRCAQE